MLIEENKNKSRILFSTVAKMTESHNSMELCIPMPLSSTDFTDVLCFFINKIVQIRDNILYQTDYSSKLGTIEIVAKCDIRSDSPPHNQ